MNRGPIGCFDGGASGRFRVMIQTDSLAELPAPWGSYDLSSGEPRAVRIGPRDLWLHRRNGEIWLALGPPPSGFEIRTSRDEAPPSVPPEGSGWSRWATPSGEAKVSLRPVFPDRALVLQPERPFRLLPRAKARVYVRVPLWVRVELPLTDTPNRTALLDEIPLSPLSDTWWGALSHGELAYWLPTTARREMRPELWSPHLAACPLLVTNQASDDLQVEKLAFRVAHLSLFTAEGRFWADESAVTYLGEGEGAQVEMAGLPPAEAPNGRLVMGPRIPAHRGMRARTFGRLAAFPFPGGGE
ncbi:MAG: DUF432 domain-containing protein [Gemmatimonadota bacterium]